MLTAHVVQGWANAGRSLFVPCAISARNDFSREVAPRLVGVRTVRSGRAAVRLPATESRLPEWARKK